MPTQNTIMGKVKASPYKASSATKTVTTVTKRNVPVLLSVIILGVALILYLRSRSGGTVRSGPLAVLTQSAAPDQSQIDNLTAGILALAGNSQVSTGGQVTNLPTAPGGGVSSPISGGVSGITAEDVIAGRLSPSTNPAPYDVGTQGELRTVGPITRIPGYSDADYAIAQSQNMSLVEWVKYQFLTTGKLTGLYGPNAGAPQKTLDASAIEQAKKELGYA